MSLLVVGFVESSTFALLDAFDRPPTYAVVTVLGALHITFWLRPHVAREWWQSATADPRTGLLGVAPAAPD